MASMYKIEPFVSDVEIKSNFDFYRIEPIHQHFKSPSAEQTKISGSTDKKLQEQAKKAPATGQQAQEEKLIESLKKLNEKLDKYIEKHGGKATGQDKAQQPKKTKEPQQKSTEKPAKADNKKEAKKPKQEKVAGAKPEKVSNQVPLVVPEVRSTASVSYRGLDAIVDPFGYKTDALPAKYQLHLQCHLKDKRWVGELAKLAQKQGVQFGESATGNRTIKVTYSETAKISLESSIFSAPVHGRVAIWKTIGAYLGLFDYCDAALTASTHHWLLIAENLLLEKETSDDVVRELCKRLSAYDFVAVHNIPSLSDYVLRSLIVDVSYFPNNVELWAKRLQ